MALTKVSRGLLSTGIVDNSNATAITIDSSENVIVNRTSVFTTAKMEIQSDTGDASTLALNSIDTDGSILEFYKAGTAVGSIGVYSGVPYIGYQGGVGGGIMFNGKSIEPTALGFSRTNGENNIGSTSYRWKDLYLSGTVNAARVVASGPIANGNMGIVSATSTTASDVANAGMSVTKYDNNSSTSQVFFKFLINQGSTANGQINGNGAGAAAFGSWSDSRLKENITDLPNQLANITALRPVEFDYIESEGGGHQLGFVAQEVEEIYPDLVGERQDGMKTLAGMGKMEARLIKAIQEQQATIESQAAAITDLTTRLIALENN